MDIESCNETSEMNSNKRPLIWNFACRCLPCWWDILLFRIYIIKILTSFYKLTFPPEKIFSWNSTCNGSSHSSKGSEYIYIYKTFFFRGYDLNAEILKFQISTVCDPKCVCVCVYNCELWLELNLVLEFYFFYLSISTYFWKKREYFY
jgi:hypothetical protein